MSLKNKLAASVAVLGLVLALGSGRGCTLPVVDGPGELAVLLPEGVDRMKFVAFYNELAIAVETAPPGLTAAGFRQMQRNAVEKFKADQGVPDIAALNKPISDRIAAAIGLKDEALTDAARAQLVQALREIAKDF